LEEPDRAAAHADLGDVDPEALGQASAQFCGAMIGIAVQCLRRRPVDGSQH
jgi:hypothetical protein